MIVLIFVFPPCRRRKSKEHDVCGRDLESTGFPLPGCPEIHSNCDSPALSR
jgi:hypothetical protein